MCKAELKKFESKLKLWRKLHNPDCYGTELLCTKYCYRYKADQADPTGNSCGRWDNNKLRMHTKISDKIIFCTENYNGEKGIPSYCVEWLRHV